ARHLAREDAREIEAAEWTGRWSTRRRGRRSGSLRWYLRWYVRQHGGRGIEVLPEDRAPGGRLRGRGVGGAGGRGARARGQGGQGADRAAPGAEERRQTRGGVARLIEPPILDVLREGPGGHARVVVERGGSRRREARGREGRGPEGWRNLGRRSQGEVAEPAADGGRARVVRGWVGQGLRARQTLGGEEVSDRAHATFLERVEDRLLKEPRARTAHPREAAPTFEGRDGGAVGIMGQFPVGHLVCEDGGQGILA